MNVRELREKLRHYDDEAEVMIYPDGEAKPIKSVFGNSTFVYLDSEE